MTLGSLQSLVSSFIMGIGLWAAIAALKGAQDNETTQDSASQRGDGPAQPKPKKQVPKVAFYVLGSAFFMTVGLTVMVIPFVRDTLRQQRALQNAAAAAAHRPPRTIRSSTAGSGMAANVPTASDASADDARHAQTSPAADHSRPSTEPGALASAADLERAQKDWDDEDEYGVQPPPPSGDSGGGGLLAVKAFGIATLAVFGSFGLGAWVVAKLMGVNSMEEFNASLRSTVPSTAPRRPTKESHDVEDKWVAMKFEEYLDKALRGQEDLEETTRSGASGSR